jgi:S1-C subfamily serine protease
LGVLTLPISPDIADELGLASDYGLLIIRVTPGGAAERAGLRGGSDRAYLGNTPIMVGGDLIISVDGQDVQDQQQLSRIMNAHRAGDTVKVSVYRGKRRMEVTVVLGETREQV